MSLNKAKFFRRIVESLALFMAFLYLVPPILSEDEVIEALPGMYYGVSFCFLSRALRGSFRVPPMLLAAAETGAYALFYMLAVGASNMLRGMGC